MRWVCCPLFFFFVFHAYAFHGQVLSTAGVPIPGAMVTLKVGAISETVYSDAQGRFELSTPRPTGEIRIRHPHFQDLFLSKLGNEELRVVLEPHGSLEAFFESLPANAQVTKLQWENPNLKIEFISQCMFCHQQGNTLTRLPRPIEQWDATIERMEGMGSLLTWKARKEFPKILHRDFDGKALSVTRLDAYHPVLAHGRVREWELGDGRSYIHDIVESHSGKIYAVDMSLDQLSALDPQTHKIRTWDLPRSELPLGGLFSGAFHPLGTLEAHQGPHSIQEDAKGKLWMTASLSTRLLSFDPQTETFQQFPIPKGVYPHTLRFDAEGNIWFTLALSNQVGKFNPQTRDFHIIDLPCDNVVEWVSSRLVKLILRISAFFPQKNTHIKLSTHRLTGMGARVLPLPYGIDISPVDGSVWYSKLYAGKIGRIDPKTFAIEEIKTPLSGPRRLRFSRKTGILWIPAFTDNALMRFDPSTKEFKTYKLPTGSDAEYEIPYALNVHPVTEDVWITGGASDRLIRFSPSEESFVSYPLPTHVTFMREIVFLNGREVCSSYSNLPATVIEGGRPKVVCLKAD